MAIRTGALPPRKNKLAEFVFVVTVTKESNLLANIPNKDDETTELIEEVKKQVLDWYNPATMEVIPHNSRSREL